MRTVLSEMAWEWSARSSKQHRITKWHQVMSNQEHKPSHSIVCCGSEQKEKNSTGHIRISIVYANYMVIYICMIRLAAILLCRPREACSIFCLYSYEVGLKQQGQL